MIGDEFRALAMLDAAPERPRNIEFGLWISELYKDERYAELECLIRLMRYAGAPTPPGYDEELEETILTPERGLLVYEMVTLISWTPLRFQEPLAWLLKSYLKEREEALAQLIEFRSFAERALAGGEDYLVWIYQGWCLLRWKREQRLPFAEIRFIFSWEEEFGDLSKLAEAAGEPFDDEEIARANEEFSGTVVSVAEGYMRLFHVDIPRPQYRPPSRKASSMAMFDSLLDPFG